jgi:hypothetical protein
MNIHHSQNVPDDEKLEEMLSQFAPQPGQRLVQMMSSAPWQKPGPSPTHRSYTRLVWGLAVLVMLLVIFMVTFIPSVRVAASQIFRLFLSASSNQLEVQVTLTSPGDVVDFSDPANFPLSVKEVQGLAAFSVKEVAVLPTGLAFVGSRYDSSYNAVTLLYTATDYKLFLTQRPVGNGADFFSIGKSAIVTHAKVGNIQAEYVVGGWKAVSTQPAPNNQTPTSKLNIYAVWDNDLHQYTLRWQAGDIVYELRSNGEGSPSQTALINLANELK